MMFFLMCGPRKSAQERVWPFTVKTLDIYDLNNWHGSRDNRSIARAVPTLNKGTKTENCKHSSIRQDGHEDGTVKTAHDTVT